MALVASLNAAEPLHRSFLQVQLRVAAGGGCERPSPGLQRADARGGMQAAAEC